MSSTSARIRARYVLLLTQRPFQCTECGASYMRATHLAAHARSHMDASEKPFACTQEGCDKAFWTAQHLHRHTVACHAGAEAVQGVTTGDLATLGETSVSGLYRCAEEGCGRFFSKRKFLRLHMRQVHADQGEEHAAHPFACSHEGCDRRFATNAKRAQHMRVHDSSRYMCVLPHEETPTFSTWTELQRHVRDCHPPQCPRPECEGRTFANRENLRKHMRLHASRDAKKDEEEEEDDDDDENEATTLACSWNGCHRTFSSPYALQAHLAKVHLREKPHTCDVCGQAYGYKHLLRQHMRRAHEQELPVNDTPLPFLGPLLDTDARRRAVRDKVLLCPWARLAPEAEPCPRRFARLYDVRRHLESAHALSVDDEELKHLFADAMDQLPAPRKRARLYR